LAEGAAGVQIGTAFAFCNESGLDPELKARVVGQCRAGKVGIFTDPAASPTGFPFKVVTLEGTLSENDVYRERTRVCDLGYLREAYRRDNGTLGFRCAAEPAEDFVAKGGTHEASAGRKCLCNGLLASVGLGQVRDCVAEPQIVTAGDAIEEIGRFLRPGADSYSAADVLAVVTGGETAATAGQL
jgi:NAD(P)H-dependent flavin oxidoreductase YrpB (nitropropane dioxygenase family)